MYSKIQLINAPIDNGYKLSLRTGVYPPLNLATLKGYIKSKQSEIEVEVLDGEILDIELILAKLDAPIVGISCNIMTYKSALRIAMKASENGSKVILGGPYASSMSERILKNRPYIDAVIKGDGEEALLSYLVEKDYEQIPNIIYRNGDDILVNSSKKTNMGDIPVPDYSDLPLDEYFYNYRERYGDHKPFRGSLATFSRKGCKWRDVTNGGCVFCMIPHFGVNVKSATQFWNEISFYNREYGVDFFWEVCDTFTEDSEWLDELIITKPSDLDVKFHIYGRPNHITKRMARVLKEIGVYEVFIGAESGDDEILKNSNKGIRTSHTLRSIEVLENEDINVITSFVLGLPGETSNTLEKTNEFAKKLSMYSNVKESSTSIMLPIPGSNAFSMLLERDGMKAKYATEFLDLEELKSDWVKNFTEVDLSELENALENILDYFPLNSSFSQKEKSSAPMC